MKLFALANRTAVAAVLALAVSTTGQLAWAYPPGQDLIVSPDKATVIKGRTFTFNLHRAQAGAVTVKYNSVTAGGTANLAGQASVMMPASAYGIFLATARSGTETATTRIYVPRFSLLNSAGEAVNSGRRGHFLTVRVEFVKFGTVVSVLSGNQMTSKAAWTTSIAKVRFQLPNKPGPASVVVNLAGQNKTIQYWVN